MVLGKRRVTILENSSYAQRQLEENADDNQRLRGSVDPARPRQTLEQSRDECRMARVGEHVVLASSVPLLFPA